jgi:excisionase family DNA binding protein
MGTSGQSDYLTTADAAKTLAVSISTVKRWVDEGILPAHVTAGGHRKLLRSEVLALARQDNLPVGEPAVFRKSRFAVLGDDSIDVSQELLEALIVGDAAMVNSIIHQAYSQGKTIEMLADRVIAPVMAEIGHQWERANIDVWHEHRATQLCSSAIYNLKRELESRTERNRPIAIGAAPEGDPYSLPTLLAQLVLVDAGWEAVNLGPNTPLASLTRAVQALRPKIVWLSVSHIQNVDEFLTEYNDFYRLAVQLGVAVAIGGQALTDSIRSLMNYTTHGDGVNHLAAFAKTLHPRPKRPRRGRPPLNSR